LYAQFNEVSNDFGIDHTHGSVILIGGGVAFIDVNNDNLLDVYMTGGDVPSDRLYLNLGHNRFYDLSDSSQVKAITRDNYTFGVAVGDINNDGCDDLFVTTHSEDEANILMLGNCNGTFKDISVNAGITHQAASTSAMFLDFNKDGFLDIYVANYIETLSFIRDENENVIGFDHDCVPNYLYINNKNNTFTEVAVEYGVADIGCGLAVSSSDYNQDGYPDIYVANDFGEWIVPNALFMNNSGENFVDVSEITGMDVAMYGMGIASGDYDNDADIDYYVTNIGANALLTNNGSNVFGNDAVDKGVDNTLTFENKQSTSWGALFADFDNNGFLDLYVANGYIPAAPFLNNGLQDDNKIYMNEPVNGFVDKSFEYGLDSKLINRGAAFGDINNDGSIDIITATAVKTDLGTGDANLLMYINSSDKGNWIQLQLEGVVSNKNAFGARIELFLEDNMQMQEKLSGGSHASQSSQVIQFGLGDKDNIDSINVYWPSGKKSTYKNISANQKLKITEDDEVVSIDCQNVEDMLCYEHFSVGCMDEESLNFNIFAVESSEGICKYNERITAVFKDIDEMEVLLYPNPAQNYINIDLENAELFQLKIFSMDGTIVKDYRNTNLSASKRIEIAELEQGPYIVQLITYSGKTGNILLIKK